MGNYVTKSLETHLFFARIMKEHALFLLAGFPVSEEQFRKRADWFREQFEDLLRTAVAISDGMVRETVLDSGEIVTEFTEVTEDQTRRLAGVSIDTEITQAAKRLRSVSTGETVRGTSQQCGSANTNRGGSEQGCQRSFGNTNHGGADRGRQRGMNRGMMQQVHRLNQSVLWLLNEFIAFKEQILQDMLSCKLYNANYPLLVEHILREAKLYRQILTELERNGCISSCSLKETETFWNQIMMEHAQFIRGLLDPTECVLMETADGFAKDYCRLLEEARKQDCKAMEALTARTIETTENYRAFKMAGTKGISGCSIRSVILPLLADHVLREANHYLRILKE